MLAKELLLASNEQFVVYEDLLNLKYVVFFGIRQFELLSKIDAQMIRLTNHLAASSKHNLQEIDNELEKMKVKTPGTWNIKHGFINKDCAFDSCLQLETLISNSYKKVVDNTDVNFSLRKKMQTQLNQMLYGFLQIKLLRGNPSQVPRTRGELLF